MSADVEIDAWLAEAGFALPDVKRQARAALEEAGLTRPGKSRLSTEKLPRAQTALSARFFLHCATPECVAFARASGKQAVRCEPKSTCQRCGGSDNQRAVRELVEACRQRGASRLVVVGGSPAVREELARLIGTSLELRLVDGTKARPIEQAKADLAWAELVLLWGATELHHKVSNQYQDSALGPVRKKLVHVPKRGIAQLLAGAVEHLRR
ncbi:MAG: hypothetical protein IT380_11575 [Myxococcales bacterium]|nr:hypothetical protein [Myxococcales bacterium]